MDAPPPPARREPLAPRPSRRDVLASGVAAAASLAVGVGAGVPAARAQPEWPLPRRALGRTGFESTVFGLGCFPLGGLPNEEEAVGVVLRALDAGCNYLDTAPSYTRGQSESRVGQALRERPDAEVFLATKTLARTGADARRDLEQSLRRLGRDRVDMVQVHAVKDADDLERILAPGGPVEELARAREETSAPLRHIGITGHADPVLMREALGAWPFDAALFPLNCVDPHHLSFERETLPAAREIGLGRVAMKVFASRGLLDAGLGAEECLRYVYGLDVSTAIVGCRSAAEVDTAARVAREARALTESERADLRRRSEPHAGRSVEWYKRG